MRQALAMIVSLGLHAGLVASALIHFPRGARSAETAVIVPVDLVTLAAETNVRAARPEPEPEAEPEDAPEIAPEPLPAEPEPEADPEPEPEIIPPEPALEPEIDPEPVDPEPERADPEPEPEPAEDPGLDLAALSQLVDRSRERRAPAGPAEAGEARRGAGAGVAMTATLQSLAASQIQRCVRSNADAPSDMDLAVVVEVRLQRNGELDGAPRLIDQNRILNSGDPYLRVAGERALRAVIECAPYRLPSDAYAQWRLLQVNVDTQSGR